MFSSLTFVSLLWFGVTEFKTKIEGLKVLCWGICDEDKGQNFASISGTLLIFLALKVTEGARSTFTTICIYISQVYIKPLV